jgi:Surface antigen variable number repeat
MRLSIRLLVFSLLASAALGQDRLVGSPAKVQVGKLVIESETLPASDRSQVIRQFQHFTYHQNEFGIREEFGERIREALRDLGYINPVVEEPTFSLITTDRGARIANVTVKVDEGEQYRIGKIQFQDAKLFPTSQLRQAFALQEGDLFNASKFYDGLQHLQNLYQEAGYINFVAAPQEDKHESSHTVDFVIDLDEGQQFSFGHLTLDGLEPRAGAGQALLNSWKTTLQGKQYSPILLHQWLVTNRSNWQAGTHTSDPITTMPSPESRVVNVKLSFPEAKAPGLN